MSRFAKPPFPTVTSATCTKRTTYHDPHAFPGVPRVFSHKVYVFLGGRFRLKPGSKPAGDTWPLEG